MFSIPFAAKLGLGAAGSLLLLGTAAPVIASAAASPTPTSAAATAKTAHGHDRRADRKIELAAYIEASADVLGMSPADLRAALKSGKSLSDIANAKGFTKERFGDASDFTFVIVGSVELDKLKPLVETYLASLPGKHRVEKEKDLGIRKLAGVVKKEWKLGQEPKARVQIDFHADGRPRAISCHKGYHYEIPLSHGEIRRYRRVFAELPFEHVFTPFEYAAGVTRDHALALFDRLLSGPPTAKPVALELL